MFTANQDYVYTVYECKGVEENNYTSTYGLKFCNSSDDNTMIEDITTNRELLEGIATVLREHHCFSPAQACTLIKTLVEMDFFIA